MNTGSCLKSYSRNRGHSMSLSNQLLQDKRWLQAENITQIYLYLIVPTDLTVFCSNKGSSLAHIVLS